MKQFRGRSQGELCGRETPLGVHPSSLLAWGQQLSGREFQGLGCPLCGVPRAGASWGNWSSRNNFLLILAGGSLECKRFPLSP